MIDKHGRNIDYLRISVTDRCNLRCIYCMPKMKGYIQENNKISCSDIFKLLRAAVSVGINKVRYTGGEPLLNEEISKIIYETSKLPQINDIAITTNGILLPQMAKDLKKAGLKRVNISLDTLKSDTFTKITNFNQITKVIDGIDTCLKLNLKPVKINTVLIKGINDLEVNDFVNLSREMPVEIRFIELMPIGEGAKIYEKGRVNIKELLMSRSDLIPIESLQNSTANMYKIKGGKGRIGYITPISCKFCSTCNKIRLTSMGTIKPCLHSNQEIDLKPYLNNEDVLVEKLKTIIFNKTFQHHINEENISRSKKMMYQIGG
ncbi:cyclic pyranopterin phosphate synthase [Clostridium acetobutylicum]|uniref:GTP 3',8-cyclase n=1 Tax=Clostridium acetobutylicum (strain ATCC 824 / DSM 792 / JCM 1419 / IAM 19013 / LMG 5710 / NBRC 13948 / NRRL B-527 / VKM B-1787 / 2291 / W) TaxID=272562 RepID=MOAA_CLOAB|nr:MULTISPECIES: GTP 3',8-cyclase MoaA [Clostridium]Q97HL8.1 RecName: Full=GTP 3',8-cyclase; AltName: Full=Molybdenum cofactor biosynthesis protein A [Clostridium acetobutylicum ATCC 824]AAK79952.1 Molybdenum cofactor biosynthesis enzyme MoaA, Fe-S oxidoreductase [Clostridium acetobutylicum ATCC 824]ADZ21045.1 Molybdenum cofactor biosynthesis enzyme MoaA, Fe-S oxidoreductase [Clostridium acetobutylicum EA 2018]AEI34018.1 molybdenum cofactor biosynthesis protein MoaA [Clostridium acetobutylicum 